MSVIEEIMSLKPIDKLHLVDNILLSLDKPNHEIDEVWKKEVESRIEAFDKGLIKSTSADTVFSNIRKEFNGN